MSRLGKRVERLEGGGGKEDVTVVAVAPSDWPEWRQEREVRAAAVEHGAIEPFELLIAPSRDVESVRLQWIGDLRDMLESIAREGRRVTD